MINNSQFRIYAVCISLVTLLVAGCSVSKIGSQTTSGVEEGEKSSGVPSNNGGQSPNGEITVEGVTVSDTNITFHGKSTLPVKSCINTQLMADGIPLPWWPGDTCTDRQLHQWVLKVPLEDNKLQADAQYVLNAYQHDDQSVTATFAFDLSGPPMPSE